MKKIILFFMIFNTCASLSKLHSAQSDGQQTIAAETEESLPTEPAKPVDWLAYKEVLQELYPALDLSDEKAFTTIDVQLSISEVKKFTTKHGIIINRKPKNDTLIIGFLLIIIPCFVVNFK